MPAYEYRITRRRIQDGTSKAGTPESAARYLVEHCYKEEQMWRENAYVLLLDADNSVLGYSLLSVGGTNCTTIDTKMLATVAVRTFARSVILSHNHTSGNAAPSQVDIRQTEKAKQALSLLDIKLFDHIIIADGKAYSFSEEKTFTIK